MFYRFGRWLHVERTGSQWIRLPSRIVHLLLRQPVLWTTRVSLPPQCRVGPGVWLGSHDRIGVSPDASVGPRARLCGGNTIGVGGRRGARGAPRIGEGVVLAPGAVAVGPITIADGAIVGPNSVAAKSIPSAGTYVGTPARPWAAGAADALRSAAQGSGERANAAVEA
jgi:serine O-acetyltransferase